MLSVLFSVENILVSSKLLTWRSLLTRMEFLIRKREKRGKKLGRNWLICYSLVHLNLSWDYSSKAEIESVVIKTPQLRYGIFMFEFLSLNSFHCGTGKIFEMPRFHRISNS